MITSESIPFVRRAKALLVACILALVGGMTTAAQQEVALEFEKAAAADTVWIGAVTGDVSGVLTTVLISADTSAPVWLVEFYWIVTADDPARSFVARLSGTLDTETGVVEMSGSVVEGYREGARVEERGQMVDPDRSAFEGTIVIAAP